MSEQVRCTLAFDSVDAFRAAFEPWLKNGACFVPYPDELADRCPMLVRVEVTDRATVELEGTVQGADFDERGNIGVRVELVNDSLAIARSVLDQLTRPAAPGTQSIFKTTGRLKRAELATVVAPGEAEEPPALEPGTILEERFQIEAHIATGGMGEVYRALHINLNRPVALKLLRKSLAADAVMWTRFKREAELVSQLESPYIVRVFDFGKTQSGQPFLAMEYVEGNPLDSLVAKGPLDPDRAVRLLAHVCDGLGEAHAQGIVHRDLKPANIIVGRRRDGSEVAKILDFGIARLTDRGGKREKGVTQAGTVMGTPAYLAPEQALGEQLDERTDIYALGCVAYELLAGRPPFVADDVQRVVNMQLTAAPAPLESLRPELASRGPLCAVVMKALAKEKERRYQTVAELRQALEGSVKPPAPAEKTAEAWPPAAPPSTGTPALPPLETAKAADEFFSLQPKKASAPPSSSPPLPSASPSAAPPPLPAPAPSAAPPPPSSSPSPAPPAAAPPPLPASSVSPAPAPGVVAPSSESGVAVSSDSGITASSGSGVSPPPLPPGRIHAALEGKALRPRLVQWHDSARTGLSGTEARVVVMQVELMGVPGKTPLHAACLQRLLELGRSWGGVLDFVEDDQLRLLFVGEGALPPSRAAYAALAMQEAVTDEGGRVTPTVSAAVRVALVAGRASIGSAALEDELTTRAQAMAARFPAGSLLVERALSGELGEIVELKAVPAAELFELGARRSHLRRGASVMLARDGVLASFDRRLATLVQGVVAPVVVRGPRGSGRSTVAEELAQRARQKGVVVGLARGHDFLRGQAFGAITEIVCAVCGVPVRERTARLRSALQKLGLDGPSLEAALVVTGVTQLPHTFTAGQAVHALRSVIRAGAVDRGVLLVFDGLESMDPQSVEAFAELVTRAGPRELTVGFAAPELATDRLGSAPTLELAPLSPADISRWAHAVIEGSPSKTLVDLLILRSRGLPALLVDWLWLLDDRGQLRTRDNFVTVVGSVPELDDAMLAASRLEAMAFDSRRVMEAAGAVGGTFDATSLAIAWPRATTPGIQRAVASGMLRPAPGRRLCFTSPRYRRAVVGAVSPEIAAMHLRLGAALIEQGRADPTSVDPALVGRHLAAAGDGMRSVVLWKHAAEAALARRALRDGVTCIRGWSDALGLIGQGQLEIVRSRVDALARAADIAIAVQDAGQARALVDEALALARKANAGSAELFLAVARVQRSEARRARATEALIQAELIAAGGPMLALIEAERGESREQEGDFAGAITSFEKALAIAEPARELARWHGEIDLQARLEARLAAVYLQRKDVGAARKLFESSLNRWRQDGWPYAEARLLGNLGALFAHVKEASKAAKCFESAAQAAARCGDFLFQARQLILLAKVAKKNEAARARTAGNEARALCIALGWEDGRFQAEALL